MKDAAWFKHDSNARYDPAIKAMIKRFGLKSYAWYWIIIETLRDMEQYKLSAFTDMYLDALATDMQCERGEVYEYIHACVHEYGLFGLTAENEIYSVRLCRDMENKDIRQNKRREAANARWNKQAPQPTKDLEPGQVPLSLINNGETFYLGEEECKKLSSHQVEIISARKVVQIQNTTVGVYRQKQS